MGSRRAKNDAADGYAVGVSHTKSIAVGNVSGFMDWKATYSEFSNPRLVEIYNTVNPVRGYKDFFLKMASTLSAESIIDLGCGSGLLSCELSEAGHRVIGVDPSDRMLDLARNSSCADQVEWINGGAGELKSLRADLVIMSGHVAQFFFDDSEWDEALRAIHSSLPTGGHLIFESRNPTADLFATWPTKSAPQQLHDPRAGEIEWWYELDGRSEGRVTYEIHYRFVAADDELVSLCELRFRTQDEINQSLANAGFSISSTFGDWDSSAVDQTSPEMIFVAAAR